MFLEDKHNAPGSPVPARAPLGREDDGGVCGRLTGSLGSPFVQSDCAQSLPANRSTGSTSALKGSASAASGRLTG
jgi:hypothetical protein